MRDNIDFFHRYCTVLMRTCKTFGCRIKILELHMLFYDVPEKLKEVSK